MSQQTDNLTRVKIRTEMVTQPDWVEEVAGIVHDPLTRAVHRVDPRVLIQAHGSDDEEVLLNYLLNDNILLRRPDREPACKCCLSYTQKVKDIFGPKLTDDKAQLQTRCGTYYPYTPVPLDLTNKSHVATVVWLDEHEVKIYDDFMRRSKVRDYGTSNCKGKGKKGVKQLHATCEKLKIGGYSTLDRQGLVDLINSKKMMPILC